MSLVRLLRLLNLNKVTQVSFAEYNSKRNYVERVHAEENRVLSKHGPFSSKVPHTQVTPGTLEHRENMENMAEEVRKCVSEGSFGTAPLLAFRGIKCDEFVFDDQEELQTFLDLNEDGKEEFSPNRYSDKQGKIIETLSYIWGVDRQFSSKYIDDYRAINNDLVEGTRIAWLDKYTTSIYSINEDSNCIRYELQPIPDYLRWLKTGELHYLPLEERYLLKGEWDVIPGVYLPTRVLNLCFSVIPNPDDALVHQIALLSWIMPKEVRNYLAKVEDQLESQMKAELERRRWKSHPLYKTNTKDQLEAMCRILRIPVTPSLAKHNLATLICEKNGKSLPPQFSQPLYHGLLSAVPSTTSVISKLTVQELRSILKHHGYSRVGTKDQLVLRVFLLRNGKKAAVTAREEEQLKDLVNITVSVIFEQWTLSLTSHVYRKRSYTTGQQIPHFVAMPSHINSENDLQHLFNPLLEHLMEIRIRNEIETETILDQATLFRLLKYQVRNSLSRLGRR